MAAALANQKEACFLQGADRFGSAHPGELVRHTATSRDVRLMDFFAAIQPILYVQSNGVPDILYGFLISIALDVTALLIPG